MEQVEGPTGKQRLRETLSRQIYRTSRLTMRICAWPSSTARVSTVHRSIRLTFTTRGLVVPRYGGHISREPNLTLANLNGAKLYDADLTDATLDEVNAIGTDFYARDFGTRNFGTQFSVARI